MYNKTGGYFSQTTHINNKNLHLRCYSVGELHALICGYMLTHKRDVCPGPIQEKGPNWQTNFDERKKSFLTI